MRCQNKTTVPIREWLRISLYNSCCEQTVDVCLWKEPLRCSPSFPFSSFFLASFFDRSSLPLLSSILLVSVWFGVLVDSASSLRVLFFFFWCAIGWGLEVRDAFWLKNNSSAIWTLLPALRRSLCSESRKKTTKKNTNEVLWSEIGYLQLRHSIL